MTRHHSCRVSPFGHPRIHARLAAPRGISQPPTSFIGSQCQGIHHAPLNTYKHKTNIQKLHINTQKQPPTEADSHILRARCSQPLSTNQTPHPTTKRGDNNHTLTGATTPGSPPSGRRGHTGLLSQSPIVCSMKFPASPHPRRGTTRKAGMFVVHQNLTPLQGAAHPTNRCTHRTPTRCGRDAVSWCSLERR